jgi:Zn-dependent protease with chaperone function
VTAPLLLTLAAVLATVVPARLARAAWVRRAPALGMLAWRAVAYAALTASMTAALTALMHWERGHQLVCEGWQVCLDALRGGHGIPGQAAAASGLLILAAMATRFGFVWWRVGRSLHLRRQAHLAALRLVAEPAADLDVLLVPDPVPAAYVVPGRHPQVVLTSGALRRLSAAELGAVLAHERAHARGRHHRLRDTLSVLATAFPHVPLFDRARVQVKRLVEMQADDVASRSHSRLALARALVTMGAPGDEAATLAMAGGEAVERLQRLLDPPPPLPAYVRIGIAISMLSLPVVPFAAVVVLQLV